MEGAGLQNQTQETSSYYTETEQTHELIER